MSSLVRTARCTAISRKLQYMYGAYFQSIRHHAFMKAIASKSLLPFSPHVASITYRAFFPLYVQSLEYNT